MSINFGWGKTIRPQWLKSPEAMTQVRNLCGIVHQVRSGAGCLAPHEPFSRVLASVRPAGP